MVEDELFRRSRGPTEAHFYDELRLDQGRAAPNPGPQPIELTPNDLVEMRMRRFEAEEAARAADRRQRVEAGKIERWEAHYEQTKLDNQQMVELRALQAEDGKRKVEGERIARLAQEHAAVLAGQAADMSDVRTSFEAAGKEAVASDKATEPGREKHHHERARHQEAIRRQHPLGDTFGTEERAAMTELSLFLKEQEQLEKDILREADLTRRTELTAQKNVRAADHLAYTAGRIVEQSEHITGDPENEVAEKFRARAEEHQKTSEALRQEHKGMREPEHAQTQTGKEGRETTDREARYSAFVQESQSAQPAPTRTQGRGGVGGP